MGCSASPWLNLDVDTVQEYVNIVYTGYDYAVEHGDGFHSSVRPRTLIFNEVLTSFKDQQPHNDLPEYHWQHRTHKRSKLPRPLHPGSNRKLCSISGDVSWGDPIPLPGV